MKKAVTPFSLLLCVRRGARTQERVRQLVTAIALCNFSAHTYATYTHFARVGVTAFLFQHPKDGTRWHKVAQANGAQAGAVFCLVDADSRGESDRVLSDGHGGTTRKYSTANFGYTSAANVIVAEHGGSGRATATLSKRKGVSARQKMGWFVS
jgi:hypothetical protein